MPPKPVLVLDGERPQALAIVRSLGRRGLPVEVGSSARHPLAALSKYCSGSFLYPDPMRDGRGFGLAILDRLSRQSYALVIPVTDETICPLMPNRQLLEGFSPLAMSSNESLAVTLSKSRTYQLARALGIPVPKTVIIRTLEDLDCVDAQLGYPLVIRPDRSLIWTAGGVGRHCPVSHVTNACTLRAEVGSRLLSADKVLIQERLGGDGVAVAILATHGEVRFAFQYRRLHEVPLTGGTSAYRVSEALNPDLLAHASSLIRNLRWNGVAMIDFNVDSRARLIHLMHVNGRFSSSLPLAVASGADFPSFLFDLILHGIRDFPNTYTVGLRGRELSRELEWLNEVLFKRRQGDGSIRWPGYGSILRDSCRMFNPGERVDTLDARDPKPGFHALRALAKRAIESVWRKAQYGRERRHTERLRRDPRPLIRKLRHARSILVVCHGNVIRSAFAANYVVRAVGSQKPVTIRSAGLEADAGGPAHPHAISKAKAWTLDLSRHVSTAISEDMVRTADVIFVMELAHAIAIRRRFRGAPSKTFLVSCLAPETPLEVADPFAKPEAAFTECFVHLASALLPIIQIVCEGEPHRR